MKTYARLAWLLFVLSLTVGMATAEAGKASGLLNVCNAVVHPNTQNAQAEAVHRPMCTGYMMGWLGGVEGVMTTDEKGFVQNVSIEDGVTPTQMAKVFALYMEAHPEEENKPARRTHARHAQCKPGLLGVSG